MFFSGKDHEVKWSVLDVVSRRDTNVQMIVDNALCRMLIAVSFKKPYIHLDSTLRNLNITTKSTLIT